jgi:hypothetical protein
MMSDQAFYSATIDRPTPERFVRNATPVPTDPPTRKDHTMTTEVYTFTEDANTVTTTALADTLTVRTLGNLLAHVTVVERYHGDWFRDAFWLQRQLADWLTGVRAEGPIDDRVWTCWWAADDCGTAIGQDRELVVRQRGEALLHQLTVTHFIDRWGVPTVRVLVDWVESTS